MAFLLKKSRMKGKIFSGILVLFFLFILALPSASGWEGYVVKVLDGDSLRVKRGHKIVEIRLYGIDCPEWGQDFGNRAKKALKKKIFHKNVTVEPRDIDRYGRTVALVRSSAGLVNSELVREGFAWMYPRYCRDQPLCSDMQDLQDRAKARKIGLWRASHPVSPWAWKWQKKRKRYKRH